MRQYNITVEKKPNPFNPKFADMIFVCGTVYMAFTPPNQEIVISPNEARKNAALVFARYWLEAAERFDRVFQKDPNGDTIPSDAESRAVDVINGTI